jgi:hypothetical protein
MFQIKVVDKIETRKLCSITLFENGAVYEMMWKSMAEPERPLMSMCYGAYTLHAGYDNRYTLRICNNYCLFTATMVTRTYLNITLIRKLRDFFLYLFVELTCAKHVGY